MVFSFYSWPHASSILSSYFLLLLLFFVVVFLFFFLVDTLTKMVCATSTIYIFVISHWSNNDNCTEIGKYFQIQALSDCPHFRGGTSNPGNNWYLTAVLISKVYMHYLQILPFVMLSQTKNCSWSAIVMSHDKTIMFWNMWKYNGPGKTHKDT